MVYKAFPRLCAIRKNMQNSEEEILEYLRNNNLCSNNYGLECLSVDMWHLCSFRHNSKKIQQKFNSLDDPLLYIFFNVIMQAAADFVSGRPCDVDIWRGDEPPSRNCVCTHTVHICREDARKFLLSVTETEEKLMQISSGLISYSVRENHENTKNKR